MEKTHVSVSTEITLHELISGLEYLSALYPVDRLDLTQINRLDAATQILRGRLEDSKPKERRVNAKDRRKYQRSSPFFRRNDTAGRRKTDTKLYYKPNRRLGLKDRRIDKVTSRTTSSLRAIGAVPKRFSCVEDRRKECQTSK